MDNRGAPWAYSSLLTKDAGGFSKKLFSGPTYAAEHILKSFLCRNFSRNYAQIHSPFAPDKVREFYESLNGPFSTNTLIAIAYFKPAGAGTKIMVSATQLILIAIQLVYYLFRVYINGKFYTTND